jgi:cathepsin B
MNYFFIVLILVAFTCCFRDTSFINDPKSIEQINSVAKTWIAGENKVFDGLTYLDAKRFLGVHRSTTKFPQRKYKQRDVPESFDWRNEKPMCVHPIRDQAQCGSCYAFGASEAVTDRFCIFSKGKDDEVLSPQWIVSCDKQEFGCGGGYPNKVWNFMTTTGIVSEKCLPYTSQGGAVEACPTKCKDGSELKLKKIHNVTEVFGADNFMYELLEGPFEVCFAVYQDFFNYKSGVYKHVSGGLAGYHAVKIIGWGVDTTSKLPYWIISNSWGESWGQKGYFWILKGKDECQMESGVGGQLPAVSGQPNL